MHVRTILAASLLLGAVTVTSAQTTRPASPRGMAAIEMGGKYVKAEGGMRYEGGKWLEISYGRPILRGRTNLFGAGADYGKALLAGAPIWRAGADVTTRLKTDVPLTIGGKTLPAGEYSLFIELKENAWTFVVSTWPPMMKFDPVEFKRPEKTTLWGAYGYTPDKDVVRAPMKLMKNTVGVEQLTWGFINVNGNNGELALWWDKEFATVPFTVAGS